MFARKEPRHLSTKLFPIYSFTYLEIHAEKCFGDYSNKVRIECPGSKYQALSTILGSAADARLRKLEI